MPEMDKEKVPLHVYDKAKKGAKITDTIGIALTGTVALGLVGLALWGVWVLLAALATTTAFWPVVIGGGIILFISALIGMNSHYTGIVEKGDRYGVIDE